MAEGSTSIVKWQCNLIVIIMTDQYSDHCTDSMSHVYMEEIDCGHGAWTWLYTGARGHGQPQVMTDRVE